jgi:hypothetical protein
MAWTIISPTFAALGGQDIDVNSTTQKFPLGLIVQAADPTYGVGEFIYLKGVANTAAKGWVHYNADDWSTVKTDPNGIGPVAIAMSACVANQYGWYQINGKALGLCATQFADNGKVYLHGTDFIVDDASVAGDLVVGAKGASTTVVDSGYAEFEIHRPFTADVFP